MDSQFNNVSFELQYLYNDSILYKTLQQIRLLIRILQSPQPKMI